MNKALSKSKNNIVGGNKFTFEDNKVSYDKKRISFTAKNNKDNTNNVKLIFFFKKKEETLKLETSDINIKKNLKIITSNIATVNYYEKGQEIIGENIVNEMINFDTCLIVDFTNICYIFLNVNTSGNKSIKNFEDEHTKLNLKILDALMMIRFKQLGLDINFVNKFMAAVKGYVDGQKNKIKEIIGDKAKAEQAAPPPPAAPAQQPPANAENAERINNMIPINRHENIRFVAGKKINTNKILNNLILKLSKINNVKKPTKPKPKVTKVTKVTKPTKPKPKVTKVTKATKPKATKATKSKAIKKI